jgi:hypothetical protein
MKTVQRPWSIPSLAVSGTSLSLGNPLTVNFNVGGTATFNTDYTQTGAAITFPTGATTGTGTIRFAEDSPTATLTIEPISDDNYEDNETVAVTLASGTGYTIGTPGPVTGTINDDNDRPILSSSQFNFIGVEGLNNEAIIVINLIGANGQIVTSKDDITFNYTTSPTGAVSAISGVDYTNSTGTVTIRAGNSEGIIRIPILNDNINELDKSFLVTLSNATNATISPSLTDDGIEVVITDTLPSAQTRTLPNLVENLTLTGTGNINGTGNAGNNVITTTLLLVEQETILMSLVLPMLWEQIPLWKQQPEVLILLTLVILKAIIMVR